ncbi:flotillin-like protein FloA [Aureliella helgolandensis]|uniref:Flotillin-like protein FloA n=1 Tax=Aureliella helgolandensis TaxID=2527968 RepID=A0A518G681_9BACT|nr:flotillin-like protein FloA [Aureliella helgolandensis]QDV24096.1 SigmaW regulon antibacterial [Aureliella helgolandensis]
MDTAILLAQNQNTDPQSVIIIVVALAIIVVIMGVLAVMANFFWLWAQSFTTGAGIGLRDLIGMWFRRVDSRMIVRSKIMAVQAGLGMNEITSQALEAHYLAGGNVSLVIRALIAARKSKIITLGFREATAIDLAGRDVLEAVQTSVYPKVIDCPPKGAARLSLDAVARDGIQLKVKARVTVRANLEQLIGGAGEETIVARVGEGIVSTIGSADDHKVVLENPDMISKSVLAKRLDSQTAFEIVSIDIADIDVGENIGARLQADRAEADMRVARAKAESRRAAAVAAEQEMMANIEESRAKLVEAEADVPHAMAAAFADGLLTVMDYYRLMNVDADTKMRSSIADVGERDKPVIQSVN